MSLNVQTKERIKSLIAYIFVASVSLAVVMWIFRGHEDFTIPIMKGGDVNWASTAIKNFIDGGDRYFFADLGGPFESIRLNTPTYPYLILGIIKLVTLFSNSFGFVLNFVSFLNFPLTAVVALFALRKLNVSRIIGGLCAIVYSTLTFMFMRFQNHLFVSFYFVVPLVCVAVFWLIRGEMLAPITTPNTAQTKLQAFFGNVDKSKLIFGIVAGVLVGLSETYFAIFGMLTLFFAGLYAYIKNKNYRHFLVALTIIVSIVLVTLIWMLVPKFLNDGSVVDTFSATRNVGDVEHYGLKFTHLVIPTSENRFQPFADFGSFYINNTPLNTENLTASLGIMTTIGFLISMFIALFAKFTKKDKDIEYCGKINLFLFIFATIGGISALINFLFLSLAFARCYARISVYIAFFSLLALSFLLMRIQNKLSKKPLKAVFLVGVALLTAFSMYTQIPMRYYNFAESNAIYKENKNFFNSIEEQMGQRPMLLQFPYVSSEHHTPLGRQTTPYDALYPYLYLDNTEVSFGTEEGSKADGWIKAMQELPTEQMLNVAVATGFKGILIDRLAYEEGEYTQIERALTQMLKASPTVSFDERYAFYNLNGYTGGETSQVEEKLLEERGQIK